MDEENNGQVVPVVVDDPFELETYQANNADLDQADARLETQLNRWFYGFLAASLVALACAIGWRVWPVERHVPYVNTVLYDSSTGTAKVMEAPVPLQDFVVPGETIQQLLLRFVDDWRRKGQDAVERTNHEHFVMAMTCGQSRAQMEEERAALMALKPEKRPALVSLTIASVLPTSSERTWRAQWDERWMDAKAKTLSRHRFMADFTLSRLVTHDVHVLARNTLGVCISSYTILELPL